MTGTISEKSMRPMCSLIARASGEDPIGTISSYRRYLAVEIPLPWASDIQASPRFPSALRKVLHCYAARGGDVRFQGLAPDPDYSRPGFTRVIVLRRPATAGAGFASAAYEAPVEDLSSLVEQLLDAPDDAYLNGRFRIESPGRDLLVCTHGAKDACCATFGIPSFRSLRYDLAPRAAEPPRVWRTSHLGGHRFAPTLIDFPDGRAWAHLDDAALDQIVRHEGPLPDLRRHYRGWTALETLPEMLVEREVFAREGWDWTRSQVQGETREIGAGRADVRLVFRDPEGKTEGAYEATVEPTGEVVVSRGSCSKDVPHESPIHRVRDLRRIEDNVTRWRHIMDPLHQVLG